MTDPYLDETNWVSADDYFAEQDRQRAEQGPDVSDENVARAVSFLEAWLPVGGRGMGSAAVGDVEVLMAYARKHVKVN